MSAPDPQTQRTRRAQAALLGALVVAGLGGVALWLAAGGGAAPRTEGGVAAELADASSAETSWVRRSEARLGGLDRRLKEMELRGRRLEEENRALHTRLHDQAEEAREVIDRQAALIESLAREAKAPPVAPSGDVFSFEAPVMTGPDAPPAHPEAAAPSAPPAPMMETFTLEGAAAGPPAFGPPRTLRTWLPAGSHAQAVVLAGVDASAGVSSQSDPRPVLLRIDGPAYTAATGGEAATVDLDGCTVTGAAHGDLSSEKVYVRLKTLTCAGPAPGTVVETAVAGFVAGAGKTGVRGPVVSREGALVEKAFLAGVVSGAGEGVSQAFAPQAVATGAGTAAVANTGLGDIARAGLGAGAGSAGRTVADYLIRRAEQYQPVVQLQAGTRVAVVFIEGARLDGRAEVEEARHG